MFWTECRAQRAAASVPNGAATPIWRGLSHSRAGCRMALGNQPAEGFPDRNWPDIVGIFGQRVQAGPCQVLRDIKGGFTTGKTRHNGCGVLRNFITVGRSQCLTHVVGSKSGGAGSAASLKAPGCMCNLLRAQVWNCTAGGRAQSKKARAGWGGSGVFGVELCDNVRRMAEQGRAAHARESSPSAAKAKHRERRASSDVLRKPRGRPGPGHSSVRSPSNHREHLRNVKWAACWRRPAPPRGGRQRTAFGSMNNSSHATKELLATTLAKARARHWAQAPRATLGMWRRTGAPVERTSWKERGVPAAAPRPADGGANTTRRASGRQRGWAPL